MTAAHHSEEKVSFRSFIGHNYEGKTILDFLGTRFKYFGADVWTQKIREKDVLLNDQEVLPEQLLKAGDEVKYFAMRVPEPKVPRHIPAIYEDEDLLIVNKPPHIPMHPTGRYLRNTLIHVLQAQKKLDNLILAHRLDRETSGLCVLTKSTLAKDKMYWAFFRGEVEKTYWALVWGRPEPRGGLIDAPMGEAKDGKIRIKQIVGVPGAKSARTKYRTLSTKWIHAPQWQPPEWEALAKMLPQPFAETQDWPVSLVEAKPLTGRTNQIRVHLAHIGAGLVGDKLYDPEESVFLRFKNQAPKLEASRAEQAGKRPSARKRPQDERYLDLSPELMRRLILDAHALHARELRFRHPRTGKLVEFHAPVPKSWQGLYDSLK